MTAKADDLTFEEMGGSVRYEAGERGSLFVLEFRCAAAGAEEGGAALEPGTRRQLAPYLERLAAVPIYRISAVSTILQEMTTAHPDSAEVAAFSRRLRELAMAGDADGVARLLAVH